jgi:hypothetical protein
MDLLSKDDLTLLAGAHEPGPHVSLFLPTHRVGSQDRTDPLRFKNLLTGVQAALTDQGLGRSEVEELLAPARALHADTLGWQYMSDGLAVFLRSGTFRTYRVPFTLPELACVGDRFVTSPLLRVLNRDSQFLLLALSQRNVRLMRGSLQRVEQVELPDVPTDLRETLPEPEARSDTMARSLSGGGSSGPAVFYGHGAADEDFKKDELHRFLKQVDDGLREHLAGQDLPMVLVGLPETVGAYRAVNSYPHVLDDEVRTNPDTLTPEQLHEAAWPHLEKVLDGQRAAALDRLGQLHGTGRTTTLRGEIVDAAEQGRVETLVVAADPFCWDRLETGAVVRLGHDDALIGCELLDRAITDTLRHGGHLHTVPAAEVVEGSEVAAILRY